MKACVVSLRARVKERMTAAAEEIFGLFEGTLAEYEEEVSRLKQRNYTQQQILEEAGIQIVNVTLEEVQIKEEVNIKQEFDIKEEMETNEFEFVTVKVEERDSEDDSQDPNPSQAENSRPYRCSECGKGFQNDTDLETHAVTHSLDKPYRCPVKSAKSSAVKKNLKKHQKTHTGERSYSCSDCNKTFTDQRGLNKHQKTHTGERPYSCSDSKKTDQKEMRHKEVTQEELNNLEDDNDEINTTKTTKWAVKILRDFLAQKNMDVNFESYTPTTLNDSLRLFYASVQSTKEGGEYSVASLRSLRAGINRHLRDVNIISHPLLKSSNVVFKAIMKRYKKSGKNTSSHHPRIPETDLESIRRSSVLSTDTPRGLVRKVWFDIQLCLARRGREGNRELTRSSFSIQKDKDGVEYVSLAHNTDTKNHKDPHKKNLRGFMFAKPGDPLCPVKSFKKYISKCPPDAKSFYLHPKRSVTKASDVWYSSEPMGVNYLGDMLKKICEEVGLSRIYTNYSLRSAAVGLRRQTGDTSDL